MNARFLPKIIAIAVGAALPSLALAADNSMAPQQHDTTATSRAQPSMATSTPTTRTAAAPASSMDNASFSERAHMKQWSGDKDQLENALKAGIGKDRTFARNALEKVGYRITSVNKDTKSELEYEVVKGDNTYEVQFDFDAQGMAKDVDVSTNMWKAKATKQALRDANYKVANPVSTPSGAVYSDRAHMKGWNSEKEQLESALATGHPKGFYRSELEKRGYRISSVNEDKPDYVEYEIVKGDNSYEVQIDLDKASGKAKSVDVTTNLWENDATERTKQARGHG